MFSCPAAPEAGYQFSQEGRALPGCEFTFFRDCGWSLPESKWAARRALTSGSCSRATGLGQFPCTHCSPSCTYRCYCHPRFVPGSCPWVHRGTEPAPALGSVCLQPSAGSSVFPLVSVSCLKDSRRSSLHHQTGLGALSMKWGCQPKKQRAEVSWAVIGTSSSLCCCIKQRHPGVSEIIANQLSWAGALNPGTAAPLPAHDLLYISMSCPMVIKLSAFAIQHRIATICHKERVLEGEYTLVVWKRDELPGLSAAPCMCRWGARDGGMSPSLTACLGWWSSSCMAWLGQGSQNTGVICRVIHTRSTCFLEQEPGMGLLMEGFAAVQALKKMMETHHSSLKACSNTEGGTGHSTEHNIWRPWPWR